MEKTENKEFEFSFTGFLKLFKGKLKAIIAVALASAILGGAFSIFVLIFSKRFYGNILTFYLPVSESTEYSNLLPLLESDIFLQKILINSTEETYVAVDKDGQPLKDSTGHQITDANGQPITTTIRVPNLPFSPEDKEAYKKYTFLKSHSQKVMTELKRYFNDIPYEKTMLKENLDRKRSDYSTTSALLSTYLNVQTTDVAQATKDKMENLQKELDILSREKQLAEEAYGACVSQYQTNELNYHNQIVNLAFYEDELEKIMLPLYTQWKTDPNNSKLISLAESGIKYTFIKNELYLAEGETLTEEQLKEKNQSRKFLHVKVQINNDEELAQRIITNIHTEMPDFVLSHATPSNWLETIRTMCVSVPTSNTIFENSVIFSIAKYVLLFVAVGEVCLVGVVVIFNLKKKYDAQSATVSIKDATDEPKDDDKKSKDND